MIRDNLIHFLKSLGADDLRFVLDRVGDGEQGASCQGGERQGKAPCPAKSFDVPSDVKHLDPAQLLALTESFRAWREAAASPARRRSRTRLWLLFLLIRYGALKLGEAITVDDREDFDFARSALAVRGDHARAVQLPKEVSREIAARLDEPACASLRGEVFHLDQGFVRRKFYEQADACGVPRELANPRVLRHSRAVELLREGLPIKVVQTLMGHQSAHLTAQYVNFSESDIKRIVNYYILKESSMKTSARNAFTGKVSSIRSGNILAEVEVVTASGLKVVSVITHESLASLGIREGSLVTATVKAPWVILVKEDDKLKTSARNKYSGRIVKVNAGQISAEVVVELPDGTLVCSLVTDESVKALDLKVGDEICALFKAFSVILNVE
ncbi:Molybdenum-pterin-binding protein MopB [Fundidesulfovibrio magnetotacticus]|uniref:Molybdenum-pterin-binding protein MopB n=1 Tax=Fundidesulfovibrio magnetotacticus TaxID=2730080 RepID=A0A6V8LYG9_9BACT|nr:TOBE domain-containing protein [Fundidesulfovibrio magnetotacticus]GFK94697.1 Molybdenum-pterin-binding protein MopB [Fundidesulfovibrio magnetotacticus]